MKESIAGRVGRIISGSVNALIDAVENAAPEVVMEEAIREVDAAIDEVRAELGKVLANKHLANTRLMEENRKHEELAEKVGTSQSVIARLESGSDVRTPSLSLLARIATACNAEFEFGFKFAI